MGGVSKPDLILGGVRLIDRVCGVLMEACGAGCVAVVPPSVRVPDGVLRTLEDPPSGGPLAGIDAGLRALGVGDDVLVVVVSVDAPGVGAFLPALLESALGESSDGRIVRGGADDSFGIEVAKLAGVPDKVVRRAKEVLKSLESGEMVKKPKNAVKVQQEEPIQLTMLTKDTEVLNRLKSLDVNTLTPIESMNILFELANMLK